MLQVSPVCRHAVAITPVGSSGQIAHGTAIPPVSPFVDDGGLPRLCGGLAPTSYLSRPAQHSLALRPVSPCTAERYMGLEGSDGFVTSTVAPIASGRSDRVGRAGLAPAGKSTAFTCRTHKTADRTFQRLALSEQEWAI